MKRQKLQIHRSKFFKSRNLQPPTSIRHTDQSTEQTPIDLISVSEGDITTTTVDVIVVGSSSLFLQLIVFEKGGEVVKAAYENECKKNPELICTPSGQLPCKYIYFIPWLPNVHKTILRQSLVKFVSTAIQKAINDKCQSIAFPAIGCHEYKCSTDFVAETMVLEAHNQLLISKVQMHVLFIIQPQHHNVYDEFCEQIELLKDIELTTQSVQPTTENNIAINIAKGIIKVGKGDLTKQEVDVVVGCSSSEMLLQYIMIEAGQSVKEAYYTEIRNYPNAVVISTAPGNLPCKKIFFISWMPDNDKNTLRQSVIDLVSNAIQNALAHNFTSIAFPAIGCGEYGCSVDVVVKTLVREAKNQLTIRNVPLTISFIIQEDKQNIYDEFCKQVVQLQAPSACISNEFPESWEHSTTNDIRIELKTNNEEYKFVFNKFNTDMKGYYSRIIRIERIQNERWYMQYIAHHADFKKRLHVDTEKLLYHGCPESAAKAISEDCFNRSFAGVNGTAYGFGVYFAANASYSHSYTVSNKNGERFMFLSRVLIGKSTIGNSSMKTRSLGFDSTTDGHNIFVTYHDAQAYAEYLITYK